MIPSHYHITQYAVELQHSALAKAEHERRLALATAVPARAQGTPAPVVAEHVVVRRLRLLPWLRPRREPASPPRPAVT